MSEYVSVIVTTKDQNELVGQCIQSVIDQDYDANFEIIVIDDASTDDTLETVRGKFGDRVKILSMQEEGGWLNSLVIAARAASEEILLIIDPHCTVGRDWISTIVSCFDSDPELSALSGPTYHGSGFMQKLTAITMHPNMLSQKREYVKYIADDNFAVRKGVLFSLLENLPVDQIVDDAEGSALLCSSIRKKQVAVLWEPRGQALHVTPDFRGYLDLCKGTNAQASVKMREKDPSMRGARLLRYPALAVVIFPMVKFTQDIIHTFRLYGQLQLHLWELPPLLVGAFIGKLWYAKGIFKNLARS